MAKMPLDRTPGPARMGGVTTLEARLAISKSSALAQGLCSRCHTRVPVRALGWGLRGG